MTALKSKKILLPAMLAAMAGLFAGSTIDAAAIQYEYDDAGRLVEVIYKDGSSVAYTYDNNGNVLTTMAGVAGEGTLMVSIEPEDARTRGAQWRVDGGDWHDSGETIPLSAGQHAVSFKDIEGDAGGCFKPTTSWTTPTEHTATIIAGQTTQFNTTYILSKKVLTAGVSEKDSTADFILLGLLTASLAYTGRRRRKIMCLREVCANSHEQD